MSFLDALSPDRETAHSRVLAWLLDPKEDHGLRGAFLTRFAKAAKLTVNPGDVAVDLEPFVGESRGDIRLTSGECYAIIENKVRGDACVKGQLKRHLRGAKKRHHTPKIILIHPPKLPDEIAEECNALGVLRMSWGTLVSLLRAASSKGQSEDACKFLDAYIRYVEKNVLNEWDQFRDDDISPAAIRAAAAWGKHSLKMSGQFASFFDAVEVKLSPWLRKGREREDWRVGDSDDDEMVTISSRGFKVGSAASVVYVSFACSPKAKSAENVWLDVEFSTDHPKLWASYMAGNITENTIRKAFGANAVLVPLPNESRWDCRQRIATLSELLASSAKQRKVVGQAADLIERFAKKFVRKGK